MQQIRRNLSYANVVATLALVVAVAGGTTAVAVSSKAGKNTVTSKSIKDGSVTGRDLAGVRVESSLQQGASARLDCQPGERLLTGGGSTAGDFKASFPTTDGNGWQLSPGGQVFVLCLKAAPGR